MVWLLAGILSLTDGRLVYATDDGYIALALSESIAEGGFGINTGEYINASSSILFPFLLAPAAGTPLHVAMPLFLSVLGTVASFWAMARVADLSGLTAHTVDRIAVALVFFGITLTINFYGIVFIGLEHSLHVAASLVVLAGLIAAVDTGKAPWWLLAAIVLATLLRFEGIVASVAAISILICVSARRQALIAGTVLTVCLVGYSAAMRSLGVSILPVSVLARSTIADSAASGQFADALAAVQERVSSIAELPPAQLLVALAVLSLAGPLLRALIVGWRATLRDLLIPAFVASVTLGHALGGQPHWLDRHDIYALATGLAGQVYIYRWIWAPLFDAVRRPLKRPVPLASGLAVLAAAAAGLYWFTGPYRTTTSRTAAIAYNIYEQHGQMSRFVREFYRAPVAINDLGYVAWRNPNYILDLVGLGSPEVWRAKRSNDWPDRLPELIRRHQVGLAMVYHWVDTGLAQDWTPMAYLRLGTPRIAPADATVIFLKTEVGSEAKIAAALREFSRTLPGDAVLDMWPECGRSVPIGELSDSLEDGASPVAEGTQQFRCPLRVELERPTTIASVALQADPNDHYRLRLMAGGNEAGLIDLPRAPGPGLRTRASNLFEPGETPSTGRPSSVVADSIVIEGFGDHLYSIGRLVTSDQPASVRLKSRHADP